MAGTIEDAFVAADADLGPSLGNIPFVVAATIASTCRAFDNFNSTAAFGLCHYHRSWPHPTDLLQ